MDSRRHTLRQRWWWFVALAALIVAGSVFAGLGTTKHPNTLVLAQGPSGSKTRTTTAKLAPLQRSQPTTLTIPALGIVTRLVTLGLKADHEVMVPKTVHIAGWYIDGPAPGQMGSAVILGHVDSKLGPGIFFELKTLKAGNVVKVALADGKVTRFVVTKVVEYSKSAFPDRLVYGTHGTESLQLVTCGGAFDHATGHYLSNIVVYTRLMSVSSSKA